MSKKHVFVHSSRLSRFDIPATLIGKTSWVGSDGNPVQVFSDSISLAIAQNILPRIDALMIYLDYIFGTKGLGGNVIIGALPDQNGVPITDGSEGAYHYGCGFGSSGGDWYEDVALNNPNLTFGLVMAEICESYMGLQNRGWNCGGSGGEGLSRFLAEIVSGGPNGVLSGFASGPSWDGTDWISKDQGTDQDYPSIGCSILYCWWMIKSGYSVVELVQAGEPDSTLASNWSALTGKPKSQAFAAFKSAVTVAGGPTSDNPFNAPTPIYPMTNKHITYLAWDHDLPANIKAIWKPSTVIPKGKNELINSAGQHITYLAWGHDLPANIPVTIIPKVIIPKGKNELIVAR